MSPAKKTRSATARRTSAAEAQLRPERELRSITTQIFRIAKSLGLPEVEVHVDEVVDALTRFANNAIHQHVAEHGLTVSLRVIVDGRTARVTTNRTEEDSLRATLESAASLASSQPKDAGLLPLPAKQKYRAVRRFSAPTAALSAESRARAVKNACSLAEKNGQITAGNFFERPEPIRPRQFPWFIRSLPADPGRVFRNHATRLSHQLGQGQFR